MLFFVSYGCQSVASGQHVEVDPEVHASPGDSVVLPCKAIAGGTELTRVSWTYEDGGDRINIAVFHPTYGASFPDSPLRGRVSFTQGTLEDSSIEISNVKMSDEGLYTCEYAHYPSGNVQGTTKLIVQERPTSQPPTVTAGLSTSAVSRGPCMPIEMEVQAFPMGSVILRCNVLQAEALKVTQVTWLYEAKGGERASIAVFHPTFGQSFPDFPQFKGRLRFTQATLEESAIEITSMARSDEGKFICQFSTYPSGTLESTTTLTMRAPPIPCLQ
ncbi:nectin-2-like [Engraulis encrasicolus]|uniref:nectin-2-like n=1 Tax=Engraulis encrasicolus TaxID=184585 RepID=UPI002FD2CBCD